MAQWHISNSEFLISQKMANYTPQGVPFSCHFGLAIFSTVQTFPSYQARANSTRTLHIAASLMSPHAEKHGTELSDFSLQAH
jgi:hypothetical protein